MPEARDGDEETLVRLMRSYQAGRLDAFERLYQTLAPELLRYFGSRARASAPDLVQETFLEIHRSRHTYTPPLPVRPWIFGVARNVERRHRRRIRRHDARVVELSAREAPEPTRARPIEWRELQDAVGRLPDSGRREWVMHHVEGLSFLEIGARLRIEVGTARLRAHRTMTALRKLLGIERRKR